MENWMKWAIPIAAGAGLLATGGMGAPALALLGGEGAATGAGAAGAAGAAEAGAAGTAAAASTAATAGTAAGTGAAGAAGAGTMTGGVLGADAAGAGVLGTAPQVGGAMAYTTPSIFPASGELSGTLAGTDLAYGSPAALAEAPSVAPPTMMEQLGGYAKQGGKAASTYGMVNGAMGGNQPQRPPPQARPVFQGQPQPIAQQSAQPQENQFARMLYEQRMRARGMLG